MADTNGCKVSSEHKLSLTVQDCIKNEVKKEGFEAYHVNVHDISTNGGNYLGALQTVDVIDVISGKEINLFVKNILDTQEDFFFPLNEVYFRESFVYKELMKKYAQLQEEYEIPEEEKFKIVKSYCELNSETIVLENVTKQGFTTGDRRDVVSLKFAEKAIAQLARFHGLSFAMEQKYPKYFEKNMKSLKCLFNFDQKLQDYLRKALDAAIEGVDGNAKVKLANFYPIFAKKYEKYISLSEEDTICMCHGDFRANNILVKKIDNEETDTYIIDYQFVNYGSPVLDLIYFIFLGTDQEFRDAHLEDLKQFYYDSLQTFLKYFDINVEDIYSRKRFEQDFQDKLDFGLIMFLIAMPLLFTNDDVVPDICGDVNSMNFCLHDSYKMRTREIVDYFIKMGCL